MSMDRRTILAMVLSLVVWYGWLAIRGPIAPNTDETTAEGTPGGDPASGDPANTNPPVAPSSVVPLPIPLPVQPEQTTAFTACGAQGTIGTDGGRLYGLSLADYDGPYHVMPLYQWIYEKTLGFATGEDPGPWRPYGPPPGREILLSGDARAFAVGVGQTPVPMQFVPSPGTTTTPQTSVSLQGTSLEGVLVTQRFAEHREADLCWIDVDVSFDNRTALPALPYVGIHDHSSHTTSRYDAQRQPVLLVDGSIHYGGALGAGCLRQGTQLSDTLPSIALPGQVAWFAMADRYFGLYAVPPETTRGAASLLRMGSEDLALDGSIFRWPDLAPGSTASESYKVYVGPNHAQALEAIHPSLSRAVDLGWFAFFGYPMLWLLRTLHGVVGNWGLAIISLTVIVKALFFPMTQRSMKSMQRMSLIQPELAAIKEKYADNPSEMNRLTIELMTKNQVNPVSGCLPMFVQMPVWIALYNVILSSTDLYHTQFLYLRDLSTPDPYCVLPIAITFLMWAQQQLSTPPANIDPVQQQLMKIMPLMFGLMFFAFPSGLAVYTFVNMTLSILQQWFIKRSLTSESIPAEAAAR